MEETTWRWMIRLHDGALIYAWGTDAQSAVEQFNVTPAMIRHSMPVAQESRAVLRTLRTYEKHIKTQRHSEKQKRRADDIKERSRVRAKVHDGGSDEKSREAIENKDRPKRTRSKRKVLTKRRRQKLGRSEPGRVSKGRTRRS